MLFQFAKRTVQNIDTIDYGELFLIIATYRPFHVNYRQWIFLLTFADITFEL